MRAASTLLGVAWFLVVVLPLPAWAQEAAPGCTGKGAPAPEWYREPPEPPPGVYQAEARSGGCEDAGTAQKMAARLGAWLLLRAKSPRAVLEETRLARSQRGLGRRAEIERRYQVLERAFARKVMDRSWVHRQETRWTDRGLSEHFMVVRADTAAIREMAASELKRLVSDGRFGPSEDQEVHWVSLEPSDGAHALSLPEEAPANRTMAGPFSNWTPPELRRLVLDWQAAPDSTDPRSWPQEGRLGLALAPDGSQFYAALGVRFRQAPDRAFATSRDGDAVVLREPQAVEALFLFGLPRQLVPLYAGYRYRWVTANTGALERDLSEETAVLGLGYPFFTELVGSRLKNLYVEAAVAPKLQALAGGGRVTLAELPGIDLNVLFRAGSEFTQLGEAQALVFQQNSSGIFFLDRLALQGGLEVRLGGSVGFFALGRFERAKLKRGPRLEADRYTLLFRSLDPVDDTEAETSVRVGMRLVF